MSENIKLRNPRHAGKHRIYDTDMLKQILYKYIEEYGGKITLAKLEKYSNIKRHIWDYNKEIMAEIERLSDPMSRIELIQDTSKFDFRKINIEQVVLTGKTPIEVVKALRKFQIQAEMALEEGAKYQELLAEKIALKDKYEATVQELKSEIEDCNLKIRTLRDNNKNLKDEIKNLNEAINSFENIILQYGLDCNSLKIRKQKNIAQNVTEYNPKREEEILSTAFPGLFRKL